MLVPYSWLKELIEVDLSPEELAERLTLTGLEVEGVEDGYTDLAKAIVVRVVSVTPHPEAEKLVICQVSDGKKDYQVVCGAPNVREGLKTVLALPETILFTGDKISSGEIRGVRSEGVLCSPYELGLNGDHSGIIELSEEIPLGQRAVEALRLAEPVLEVAITPNRGDCLSILGMAREVSAITGVPFRPPESPRLPEGEEIFDLTSVTIEVPELCHRYAGRLIRDISVRPSPFYIQKRLWLCGLRPINNIVDITNYVLLLVGQPLHAFDFDLLEGRRIIVRTAKEGEKILTLDGEERRLSEEMMVIADTKRPVAIAGIMGGEETAVSEKTKNVFLESAWFNPSSIRRTSQRLRLSTESSYRFERGVDPEGVILGLEIAAGMMAKLAGGEVVPGRIDEYPRPYLPREIKLHRDRLTLYLNVDLPQEEAKAFLERVQVKCQEGVEGLICTPPSFRHDLVLEEDLIEEIARLYGYEKIPSTIPVAEIGGRPPERLERLSTRAKDLLIGLSLYEVINYSFISPRFIKILALPGDDPRRRVVPLANPLSEEQSVMRTTLIPGLIQTAQVNIFREAPNIRVFELGRVFFARQGELLPEERLHLAGLLAGLARPETCHEKPRRVDFFDLKGILESFLDHIGAQGVRFKPQAGEPFLRQAVSARIMVADQDLGFLGELRPDILEKYDLRGPLFVFEIDFEHLVDLVSEKKTYRALPKFPATIRDLAMILDDAIPAEEVLSFVKAQEVPYLEKVSIFDVYRGKPIPEGQKSLTLRFVYRAKERTLTDEEVNEIQARISQKILKHFKAVAR